MTTKRTHFGFQFATAICILLVTVVPSLASTTTGSTLNLTPEQITALEGVVEDLGAKQFKISGEIERTLLELKLEFQREDRFATEAKAAKSAHQASKLIMKLAGLQGDMLKVEITYLLKAKDVLTREQRQQLIQGLDFEMDSPQGWMQEREIEVLVVDLDLSDEQLKKIMGYRVQMEKKAVKIAMKMDGLFQNLKEELMKDSPDDKKIDKLILQLTDQGVALLNNRLEHILKAKDVLTVAQKKLLLHALFIDSGF